MRRLRSAVVPVVVVLLVLILIGVAGLWTGVHDLAPNTSWRDFLGVPGGGDLSPLARKLERDEPVNLLLLARGGSGNDNPNVTDTIMVVALRARSSRAIMVSLPRVAWVTIPALSSGGISGKLYSAYALGVHQDNPSLRRDWRSPTGAGDLAAATVSQMTGMPIDAWMVIDVDGFRDIIDAMGGVRIKVPVTLDDPGYPADDTGRVRHVRILAGEQVLNGERADEYARSRLSTSESDRSRRQQQVLLATLSGLRAMVTSPRVIPLIGALQGHLLTNLRFSDARRLADAAARLDGANVRHVVIDESNFMYLQPVTGGDEILVPRGGDYTALRRYLVTVQAF